MFVLKALRNQYILKKITEIVCLHKNALISDTGIQWYSDIGICTRNKLRYIKRLKLR